MKVRARANGDIVELDEAAALQLIEAGIYEAVTEDEKPKPAAKRGTARA